MVTLKDIKENRLVRQYMDLGNAYIGNIGAIEHNINHAELSAELCSQVLARLGYSPREAELGAIAGYLHDIGNLVNRYGHGMSGALIAFSILLDMGMEADEIAVIMGAIGNHEENSGGRPVNNVGAALILADKSDVHRSRVRKQDFAVFTPRDRVNYAVTESKLLVDENKRQITMKIQIDTRVCSVMEYFEIFLTKMLMSRRAAEFLGCEFELLVNDNKLL
ncbi:MAG TPA: HD domain-containing protein [Syntrophomonadaceae bacterium]|nr:HD domain-containing protein [Syntrophomonadaceae bacterium]HNX29854.1 HD domain-containing protein [Syntrophomonadaceae bacterium]HPR92909.1 HD domain-containing protein [Syntrophomonadaceae bacterium]